MNRSSRLAAVLATFVAGLSISSGALADPPPVPPSCAPSPEVCDGIDNDCDDLVDEGNPGGAVSCDTGFLGQCASGTTQCVGGSIVCTPEFVPGANDEICNGIDDDCDGGIDEGFGVGSWCDVGFGACKAYGWIVCNAGGGSLCNAVPNAPVAEVCDGVDNDCDGYVDEGDPGGGAACDTGYAGPCGPGVRACLGAVLQCVPFVEPSSQPEVCDGIDNDCDGTKDENTIEEGVLCNTGMAGLCNVGVITCNATATLVCASLTAPGQKAETCGDDVDTDCDGMPSNGCPPEGSGGSGGGGGSETGTTTSAGGSGEGGSGAGGSGEGGSGVGGSGAGSAPATGGAWSTSSGGGEETASGESSSSSGEGGSGGSGASGAGASEPDPSSSYGTPFGCACSFTDEGEDPIEDVVWVAALAFAGIVALSSRRRSSNRYLGRGLPRRR